MAVVLYSQGTTHTANGIKCQMQVFNEFSFLHMLDAGWFLTPEEVYGEKVEEKKPAEEGMDIRTLAKDKGVANWQTCDLSELKILFDINDDDEGIRAKAKEAGIRNWHNRKIETLKEMLNDAQS